jgi:hypothetical protein
MMEVILIIVGVVLALGEGIAWDQALLWHGEKKRDPRNFPSRR